MTKLKILIWHLIVFIAGLAGIAVYVFIRLSSPSSGAGLGGIIVMPAVTLIYVIIFGILCTASFVVWLVISFLRTRRKAK